MRFVAFADYHAHLFTDFSETDEITGNSRFTQMLGVLAYIREYCVKENIEYVLFAGDMFHKRVSVNTTVFNLVLEEIKKFIEDGLRIIMIPGNHDQVDNTDFPEHSLKAFGELENVTLLDRFNPYEVPTRGNGELVYIFPVPYSKNAEMIKEEIEKYAYITTNEGIEEKSILLGHLGISGAFIGKSSYAMSDAFTVEDLFPHAFRFGVFGHFHKRQFLGDTNHFFYTGAPIQHNFNDEGQEKGFMVLDTKLGTAEFVEVPSPKFITVTNWKDTDPKELEGNFIRYQVSSDEVEELMETLPEDSKHRLEVQKVYDEERRVDVDFSMSYEEIISEYAKKFRPEAENIGLEIFRDSQSK